MKKLLCTICSVLLLCGCTNLNTTSNQPIQQEPLKVYTALNDVEITLGTNITYCSSIPISLVSNRKLKALNVEIVSNTSIESTFDYQEILDDKLSDDYYAYTGYITLENISQIPDEQEISITNIKIYEGSELISESDAMIEIKPLPDSDEELYVTSGEAILGFKTLASNYQNYRGQFDLIATEELTIKNVTMYDTDLKVNTVECIVNNGESQSLKPDNINLKVRKDSLISMTLGVSSLKPNEHNVFTRNYIYCIEYEINDETKQLYFDSGVIEGFGSYQDLINE